MVVENLLDAVEQTGHVQRKELLEEIQQSSKTLATELDRFINLCSGFKIFSFYETAQTRQILIVRSRNSKDVSWTDLFFQGPDKSWRREGAFATAVEDTSALLKLPNSIEERIPVDENHSNLVKFATARNTTYGQVRTIIEQMLSEAPALVASRFCML